MVVADSISLYHTPAVFHTDFTGIWTGHGNMKVSGLFLTIFLLFLAEQIAADDHIETLGDITFECERDWRIYKGNCYKPVDVPMIYDHASLTCMGQGGFLYYAENELEYFDFVSKLLPKTIWFDLVNREGKWMIRDNEVPLEYIPGWGNLQPNEDYNYTSVHPTERLMLTDKDNLLPFVCKHRACRQGHVPCDLATKCIPKNQVCNRLPECIDGSDENNCPDQGTWYQRLSEESGSFSTGSFDDFQQKTWILEAPIGKRIRLYVPQMNLETNVVFLEVWTGGPTFESSEMIHSFTGSFSSVSLYSWTNFLTVRMYAKDVISRVGSYTFGWSTNIPQIPGEEKAETATDTWKSFTIPFSADRFKPKDLELFWRIEGPAGRHIFYYLEIFPESGYAEDEVEFKITAENWEEDLQYRDFYVSNTNVIHIRSYYIPKFGGVRLRYRLGCELETAASYGRILSPMPIPNDFTCSWTLTAGQAVTRGMSLKFHKLDLMRDQRTTPGSQSQDKVLIYVDQSTMNQTGFSEGDIVHAPNGQLKVEVMTDAAFMSPGFVIGFGRDCEPLMLSEETIMSTDMTYIFEDVTLSCPTGYKFHLEKYKDNENVTLTCHPDGWKIDEEDPGAIPECQVVSCGPPTKIENGGVDSATAVIYDGVATYFCNEGFSMTGGPNATCSEDGQWIDVPTCTSTQCNALDQSMIPNGMLQITRGNNFTNNNADSNTVVEFSCDEGYEITGAVTSVCNTLGWTHEDNPPTCQKISCSVPQIPNSNVPLAGPTTKTLYQETYSVTCNNNYEFSTGSTGTVEMLCQANGTFDQTPVCEDIDECTEGSDQCNDATTECINEEGSYMCMCKPGFQRSDAFSCTDIRECDDEDGGCSTTCEELQGSYRCTCNDGYQLFEGDGFNGFDLPPGETGLRRGDIYFVNHTCVPVMCPELQPVANGKYLATSLNNFHYPDSVTLQCNDGYRVDTTGNTVTSIQSTCGNDGTWDAIYSCEARQCSLPATPAYGVYDMTEVMFGERVTLTCNLTELVKKELTAVCIYDSDNVRFAGDDITVCPEIDCGDPELVMPAGGTFLGGAPTTTTYFGSGSSFQFTCESGFDVTGMSSDSDNNRLVKCKENGRWDLGTLACTGKMCDDPGTPGDAMQVVDGYEIGSVLHYTCNRDGFTVTGPANYTCIYNSNTDTATWSDNLAGNLPACEDTTKPVFTGDCGKTFDIDAVDAVSFSPGSATDNFNTLASFSTNNHIRTGDRVISDTSVTYTATDFENIQETCTINFNVIDRNTKPTLTCPNSVTVEVSSRDSETYNTSSEVTVSGGELVMNPSSLTVTVNKIGTAETVTGIATDQYGNEASCTFLVNFEANACFQEQLFVDNNAVRTCTEDGGNLVCTSTCKGNYLYSDRTSQKNFTCSGTGNWDYINTVPHERFCLESQNPEYEVDVYLKHNLTTITGSCVTQYKAALQTNVGTFRTAIANICEGQQWSVSVITAEAADGLFEFEANFKLTLLSLSAGSDVRQMCIDKVNEQVFRLPGNQLNCNGIQNILPVDGSIIKGEGVQTCSSTAFQLVGDVCLSYGPGQYFDIDSNNVASCLVGEYQDGLAQTSCKTCPSGQYPNSDRTRCQVTCSNGFISASGFYSCTPCPVDQYWTAKDTCTACPGESSTVGKEGASDISQCYEPCPAGTYSRTGYNVNGCTSCPVNFYQDETAQKTCKECSADRRTTSSGSNSSSNCILILDACDSDYCNNNGDCSYQHHRRVCNCNAGYYGDRCQSMYRICNGNPCTNGATCNQGNDPASFTCACRTDLDTCTMTVYSETKIGPNVPAPYQTIPGSSLAQCERSCLNDDRCKDATYSSVGNGFCILYNITLQDSELQNQNQDGDKHLRKSCNKAFAGDLCELDTDDNCANAGCSENSKCMDKINGFECICPSAGGFTGTFCSVANDPCSPNPCVRGTCQAFGSVRYECTCPAGYEGMNCEVNINECMLHPQACAYDGMCSDLVNGYSCSCKSGFSGRNCQNTPNFCSSHNCGGNNICYNSLNRMEGVCVCDEDLFEPLYRCAMTITADESATDQNENIVATTLTVQAVEECEKLCQENPACEVANFVQSGATSYCLQYNGSYDGRLNEDSTAIRKDCNNRPAEAYACNKIAQPCDSVNCNNGTCQNIANGLLSRCLCETGFTGSHCQHSIDDCVSNACENGATCVDGHLEYTCTCADGFEGQYCQNNINECPGSCNTTYGMCNDMVNGYECQCNPGYTGEDCDIEINECSSYPCKHGGQCIEKVNGFECTCIDGWEGDTCEDRKNNCAVRNCLNGGECISLEESSFCRCEGGATGENCENAKQLCDTLSKLDVCVNDGVCVNTAGTARCSCPVVHDVTRCYFEEGMIGKSGGNRASFEIPTQTGNSLTVESCKTTCLNNKLCASVTYTELQNTKFCLFYTASEEMLSNSQGSVHYRRNCPTDYSGVSCELVKDWCAMNPCKHDGTCVPVGPVGYECKCEPGYSGPTCEVEADPCASNPCRGQAKCQSTATEYICQCDRGNVWAGTYCKTSRTDYTLLVNANRGQDIPRLQTTFPLKSDMLSVMMEVRVHNFNQDQPLASLFALVVTSDLHWMPSLTYDFSLSVTHTGIFVITGSEVAAMIEFSDEFGKSLFDGEWHHLGISINNAGRLSATIDAFHYPEPVDARQPFSFDYNAQVLLGYGAVAEYKLVEVYNTYLSPSVFSNALAGTRPTVKPVQAFTNFYLPPTARMNSQALNSNLFSNPNLDIPEIDCSAVEDVHYVSADRLTSMSSITQLASIYSDVTSGMDGLTYEHSVESTLVWDYYTAVITGQNKTNMNYGECRFSLYIRYNAQCPDISRDSSVEATPCPVNDDTNSYCDISCATESQRLAAPTPNYIICGSLGVNDYRTPFSDVILPSCMSPVDVLYQLDISMQFVFDIRCGLIPDNTLELLDNKIREEFLNEIDPDWPDICADTVCSNLKDLMYECDTVFERRVSVKFSLVLQSLTLSATGGGNVNIKDALMLIIRVEKQINIQSVAGATLIESSVEINQKTVCPAGNRLDETGDSPVCIPCSQGMYLMDGKCVPCDYGQYQNETGKEECKPCEDGKTTYQRHSKSASDCKEICKAGNYFDEEENVCKPCARHFYQHEDGINFCYPCDKEYKTVGEGSDSGADCKADCPPGEERSAETGLCNICERGYWRSLEYDDCQMCPVNTTTFKDKHAKTMLDCEMDICELGYYFDVVEEECLPCSLGYYQDELYMLSCKTCRGNTTTREVGTADPDTCEFYCAPGYQRNGTQEVCLMCERGYYKDNVGMKKFETCRQCPFGTTDMQGATSADNCSIAICSAGQFINSEKDCDDCPLDSFSDIELPSTQTSCLPCNSLSECDDCDELYGTMGTGSTSDQCMRYCPAGEFLNGAVCDLCVRGYYKDNSGNTRFQNCTKCPDKDGSEMTTDMDGAEDVAKCSVYKCPAGSIHTSTGCKKCELNTYQTKEHPLSTDTCMPCQPKNGLITNTRSTGTVSPEDCLSICDDGKYLVNNACLPCPRGTYKENVGNSRFENCTECPVGLTTEEEGSNSAMLCSIPKCLAGFYLLDNECTACPQDQYSEVVNPNSDVECIQCPTENGVTYGTENQGTNLASLCKPTCPGGKQFDSEACSDCPIGTFKGDDDRFGQCKSCETVRPGYVTNGPGAKTGDQCNLRDCQPGEKIVGSACEKCPIGTYQNDSRKDFCIECGVNLSTDGDGKTSIDDCQVECDPGLEGIDICVRCPEGKFKPEAGYANCQNCPEDLTSNEERTVCDIVYCSIGKEYTVTGTDELCDPCEVGFYKNEVGNDMACTQCPEGTTTNGTGQASCDLLHCVAGKYKLGSECVVCPVGTYKSSAGNQECTDCPAKSTTGDVTGATSSNQCDTVVCDPGRYRKPEQKPLCTPCEIGKYQPAAGETSCFTCPNNEITLNDGQASIDACVPECKEGQQYNETTELCILCPTGTYKETVGNLDLCVSCEEGKTTAGPGSTSNSDCSENVCPAGTYYEIENDKVVCIACPVGKYSDSVMVDECTDCPAGNTTQAEGSDSLLDCIVDCQAGYGYQTADDMCEKCPRGQFNNKQGNNPNTCKLCPSGKTNSQAGSTSCSFPAPPLTELSINIRFTVRIRVALDSCSDDDGLNLLLNRILEIFKILFQQLTDSKYNRSRRFCRGQKCANLGYSRRRPGCQQLTGLKREITNELTIEFLIQESSKYITDSQDDDANLPADEVISQILTLYPGNLSNPDLEILFVGFSNITTTDLCVQGQQLVDDTCTPCPVGHYGSAAGTCTQCPVNTYQNTTGSTECTMCPDKTYTENKNGSTSINDCIPICQAGFEFKSETKTCAECTVGYYKDSAGNDVPCTQCPSDKTTEGTGSTSASDCSETVCIAGQYYYTDSVTGDIKCNPCDIGTYNPDVMADSCETCPDGETTILPGRKAVDECIRVCGPGSGYDSNADNCFECPKGQYNDGKDPNPNTCKFCPTGKTNLRSGQASCEVDLSTPREEKRITIVILVTFEVSIDNCATADLNFIRTRSSSAFRTLFSRNRDNRYNRPSSYCTDNCSNMFLRFPNNDPIGNCKAKSAGRRKRELTHTVDFNLEFTNVTEGTVDTQTNAEVPTKEVINQILQYNKEELTVTPDQIVFGSAGTPQILPVCKAGQQPMGDTCVECGTGSYSESGESCVSCPADTYQNEAGQSSCKDCPARTYYDGTGATASTACGSWCNNHPAYCNNRGTCSDTGRRSGSCSCSENYEGDTCAIKKEPKSDLPAILGGAIGGGAALLFIILIAVGLIYRCSRGDNEKRKRPYQDPEYVQNAAYDGMYDNHGFHSGQVRPVAPYPSIGYPAIGYNPDTSFDEGTYARAYKYRPSIDGDDKGLMDDSRFVWTA